MPQSAMLDAELVVARSAEREDLDEIRAAYPSVRFVACPRGATIPHLRAAGMAAASGDILALTEDHCIAAPNWLEQIVHAQQAGYDVVGGAMHNAQRQRAVDWAAYFSEYGFFAESGGTGPGDRPLLTGANVVYSRAVAEDVMALSHAGEWENVTHDHLLERGKSLHFVPTAAVLQNQNYRFFSFCRDRYEHGLDYARRRVTGESVLRRWTYFAGSLLLPFLLTARVARASGRQWPWAFARALPLTFAFFGAWSLGEAAGYWRGPVRSQDVYA